MNAVPRILVASDAAVERQAIASMLKDEPWHVLGAGDGKTVVELVRSRTADLVLMESAMDGVSGLEICRQLRRDGRHQLLPIVLISGRNDLANRVAALDAGADDVLSTPVERNELVARVRSLLHLKSMHDRLEDTRRVILALARAAEAKDLFTLEHAERVADMARDLARRIQLPEESIEQIHMGALVHDVGKIAVPDHILNKPGPLTDQEFDVVRTHPLVGSEIVAPLSAQPHVRAIVRNHHERWDGKGYPDRLAAQDTPLAARIVAICDAYDAMVNRRPYRGPMSSEAALLVLLCGRGTQWDASLVNSFVSLDELN